MDATSLNAAEIPGERFPKNAGFGKLVAVGRSCWKSSSGLLYGEGSEDGNRILHLLSHLQPRNGKPKHSRFACPRQEILKLIDAAWSLREKFPPIPQGGKWAYLIPMGRVVGTRNETWIELIVKGKNRFITAFPVQPGRKIARRLSHGLSLL